MCGLSPQCICEEKSIIFSGTFKKWLWISARMELRDSGERLLEGCSAHGKHRVKKINSIVGSWHANHDAQRIKWQTCLAVNLPTEGRVSEKGQRPFDENSLSAWCLTIFKGWKHQKVKRTNPGLCCCCYCRFFTRHGVISPTLPVKGGLIFTDQLTC